MMLNYKYQQLSQTIKILIFIDPTSQYNVLIFRINKTIMIYRLPAFTQESFVFNADIPEKGCAFKDYKRCT